MCKISSGQIIGPTLFGVTYMKTVATFPKAIFFLSATVIALALVFLSFVRIDQFSPQDDQEAQTQDNRTNASSTRLEREETLVDLTDARKKGDTAHVNDSATV